MAQNGIFDGDLTAAHNEDEIEQLEAQDDGVRSEPHETYECVRHKQLHFRSIGQDVCNTPEHCTFCDGSVRKRGCRGCYDEDGNDRRRISVEKVVGIADWPLPTEEDFEQLRQSLPPRPRLRPLGAGPFANPCAPGSHDDFDHAQAVADVAADLRSRGGRVSFPSSRRRRTRVRDRVLRWVFSVLEDMLEDAAERLIEAKMHLDVGVDDLEPPLTPSPYPFNEAPSVYDDYPELDPFAADRGMPFEVPQYDGEQSFANRLYCGVFGRGGIGR